MQKKSLTQKRRYSKLATPKNIIFTEWYNVAQRNRTIYLNQFLSKAKAKGIKIRKGDVARYVREFNKYLDRQAQVKLS
ncbi:MAG: hypothetical protein WCI04_02800 [archaeon]